ncbi:peroxiredoxin [Oceaniradius stylonematis]|uniref:Glutathione-dependent peroxiredoxin n=1 Tax=Oceaniradius stylonematis TaxID=2184161 RepID=A0A3A8AJF7_9HYPH|nr:peroxiredoxin [Oceaniradius stylonematis]RKF06794.1 peroxiredoxin [Oceaniradius stylonematis]
MTIETGAKLPAMTLKTITEDGPADIDSASIFDGKTVVLFAVPGAFTGTCTLTHLPGYLDNRDEILAKGVDEIAVLAINDPFVMAAWAEQTGGMGKIRFLADWDGAFTKAIGMDIDLSVAGLGVRSKRYSMLVKDRTVTSLNVEDSPGEAEKSGAAAMLGQLD